MGNNIEKIQIPNNINADKYPKLAEIVNKNTKLGEISEFFSKFNENSKEYIDIKNNIIKISEFDNSNKQLKVLKNSYEGLA